MKAEELRSLQDRLDTGSKLLERIRLLESLKEACASEKLQVQVVPAENGKPELVQVFAWNQDRKSYFEVANRGAISGGVIRSAIEDAVIAALAEARSDLDKF